MRSAAGKFTNAVSDRSITLAELMGQQESPPRRRASHEFDHFSLHLSHSQQTIASVLTPLTLAETPIGKRVKLLQRSISLDVDKQSKQHESSGEKQERRESRKQRRSSANPERRKSSSTRHERRSSKKVSLEQAPSDDSLEKCKTQRYESEHFDVFPSSTIQEHSDRKERKKRSSTKKSKRTLSDHSSSSSSREKNHDKKEMNRRRRNSLPEQPCMIENDVAALPFIPSLGGRGSSRECTGSRSMYTRSNSFRSSIPNSDPDAASYGRLSSIDSIGSRGEAGFTTTNLLKSRSLSIDSECDVLGTGLNDRAFAATEFEGPIQGNEHSNDLSASSRMEHTPNLSSPDLEFLQFKRNQGIIRNNSFRLAKMERSLNRTLSSPNLSPNPNASVRSKGHNLVETMRQNLEAFTFNHAPSEAEEMIALMRKTLDDVAAKHESSQRSRSSSSTIHSSWSSNVVAMNKPDAVPSSNTRARSHSSRPENGRRSRSKGSGSKRRSSCGRSTSRQRSNRRSLSRQKSSNDEDTEKQRGRSKSEQEMQRLGTNIDGLFKKWGELQQQQQHEHRQQRRQQGRLRRNSATTPVA